MEVDDEFNRLIRSDGWSFHIPIVCDFVGRSTIQSLVRSISLEPALVQRKFPLHRIAEIRNPNTPQPLVLERTNEPLDDGGCAETTGRCVARRYLSALAPGSKVIAVKLFSFVRDDVLRECTDVPLNRPSSRRISIDVGCFEKTAKPTTVRE